MKIVIYHNSRCRKSREALEILNATANEIEVFEYLKVSLKKNEIRGLLKKLNCSPLEIVRKGEAIFKERFKGKELNEDEWIDALVKYPILIERPIVINGDNAVIGRPPEKVKELL